MKTIWPVPATNEDDDEADRQMLLLAIAKLALERPGWDWTLRRLAGRMSGRDLFEAFKKTSTPAKDQAKKFGPRSRLDTVSCPVCGDLIKQGDFTTLEASYPASREDAEKARDGRPFNSVATEVHWECRSKE